MLIETYQKKAHETAIYPKSTSYFAPRHLYVSLGLINEAGELIGLIKKGLRGDYGITPVHDKEFIKKLKGEIGDVCWYLAELCNVFDFSLSEIMASNLDKLADRKKRGVLKGDGDER